MFVKLKLDELSTPGLEYLVLGCFVGLDDEQTVIEQEAIKLFSALLKSFES